MYQQLINEFQLNPKRLFLVDGFGALLSAFCLGVILTRFESFFGMPKNVLYFLAFLPCVFALYDFFCYKMVKDNWRPFLKVIAIANLLYCLLSIGFLIHDFQKLTILGIIYFVLELIIVIFIAYIELKVATKTKDG